MPDNVTPNAPPRIWLQVDAEGDPEDRREPLKREHWDDLTWCSASAGGVEVEYVRIDLADAEREALKREVHALKAQIEGMRSLLSASPIVEVKEIGTDAEGVCRVFAISTPDELQKGPPLTYQRAKLIRWPHNAALTGHRPGEPK